MSLAPGIYDGIPADVYHADPCAKPSLSSSIAHRLATQTPAHAWAHHSANPARVEEKKEDRFDFGTAAHAAFLQDGIVAIVPFKDRRTNEAKQMCDDARANGYIPLLPEESARVDQLVKAARSGIASLAAQPPLFTDGKPEQTLVWEDDHGVLCRARLDWLRDDYKAIDDLKTAGVSADPRKWTRTGFAIGIDVQVVFYMRGVEKLTGVRPAFRYVLVEIYPPFALSVVELAPSAIALGEAKVQAAIDTWAACLETGVWPAYDRRVASLDVPTWVEMEWLDRQELAA